jgi:hypothetical protein
MKQNVSFNVLCANGSLVKIMEWIQETFALNFIFELNLRV